MLILKACRQLHTYKINTTLTPHNSMGFLIIQINQILVNIYKRLFYNKVTSAGHLVRIELITIVAICKNSLLHHNY